MRAPATFAPLVISIGDPAGIGSEILCKAWAALRDTPDMAFAAIAPAAVLEKANPDLPLRLISDPSEAVAAFPDALPVLAIDGEPAATPGMPDPRHAAMITQSIKTGVTLCRSGAASGLVTCPIAKDVLYAAGFKFPGHTEYLGVLCEGAPTPYAAGPVMMLAAQDLRVGLATVHVPVRKAVDAISTEGIVATARVMLGALTVDFGITKPRLALAGLNPHAGEAGTIGVEEIEIINPAAARLRAEGHDVTNAQPADTLFHAEARAGYDAVLAMYHDQGLIPVKTLDFHGGVNITLGLSIIRTSPDHGTAFDIAGRGIARPDSLIAAIRSARMIAKNRASHVD